MADDQDAVLADGEVVNLDSVDIPADIVSVVPDVGNTVISVDAAGDPSTAPGQANGEKLAEPGQEYNAGNPVARAVIYDPTVGV